MGISMRWKAVIPSTLLEDGWGDNLDGDGVKSEQEVAHNVVEVETKLLENALLEQKNKPAEQVAVMEPSAGHPRKDKVMDMDALELQSGIDEQAEVGISLKPAGILGLDVGKDLPSIERVKSGALSSMETLKSGEVPSVSNKIPTPAAPCSNKTGSPAVLSGSNKTPCPASAFGKGKEVQQVYHTAYGETFRTPCHKQKKLRGKTNRAKGLDLWDKDHNMRALSKELLQDPFIDELNNILIHLYKMTFLIEDIILMCENAHKKRGKFFQRAWRVVKDEAEIYFLLKVEDNEDCFKTVASNLKSVFYWIRTTARGIRYEIIRLEGRPINDPFSVLLRR